MWSRLAVHRGDSSTGCLDQRGPVQGLACHFLIRLDRRGQERVDLLAQTCQLGPGGASFKVHPPLLAIPSPGFVPVLGFPLNPHTCFCKGFWEAFHLFPSPPPKKTAFAELCFHQQKRRRLAWASQCGKQLQSAMSRERQSRTGSGHSEADRF